MKNQLRFAFALSALSTITLAGAVAHAAADKPNVILIFIDDLGYADISPFGPGRYETPNLDRMARQGRMFTNFAYYAFHTEPRSTPELTRLHAVREGQWKYYLIGSRFLNAASHDYMEVDAGALFDLESDPGETSNVAGRHPQVVARMKALAENFRRELGDMGQPGTGFRKAGCVGAPSQQKQGMRE